MIKFSRSYDRSVLIYRETGSQERILLRLGKTYEDGECIADDIKSIPEGFTLLTYIVSKDPEALIEDIANRFTDYLDDDTDLAFKSVVFDTLKLQEHISKEMSLPGGSELLKSLDILYGRQVMEILFAATFGEDGRKHGKALKASKAYKDDRKLPMAAIGMAGFVAILVIPVVSTLLLRPDIYTKLTSSRSGESVILNYASNLDRSLASAHIPDEDEDEEDIFLEAQKRKQNLFLISGLGTLSEDYEYRREIFKNPAPDQAVATIDDSVITEGREVARTSDEAHEAGIAGSEAPSHDIHGKDNRAAIDAPSIESQSQIAIAGEGQAHGPDASVTGSPKSLTETLKKAFASSAVSNATLSSDPGAAGVTLPEVTTKHGISTEIAKFRIKEFRTFRAEAINADVQTEGVTATYDIGRKPETIFEVVRGDLSGLGRALDAEVEAICGALNATQNGDAQFVTANLSFDLGFSPFIATMVNSETCAAGEYAIWPMFNLELDVDTAE